METPEITYTYNYLWGGREGGGIFTRAKEVLARVQEYDVYIRPGKSRMKFFPTHFVYSAM